MERVLFLFDGLYARGFYRQFQSGRFLTTTGRVLARDVKLESYGDSFGFRSLLRYEYRVDGQRYESDRVR